MEHFDVFNGDADGICALQQLRLAKPMASSLVTGVKRDIELLARVPARPGVFVTVLDISVDANRGALLALLQHGVKVEYFDHHFAGVLPEDPNLTAHIDTTPEICTSLLVNRHLTGAHWPWAIVGAFGDNLGHAARALAQSRALQADQIERLRELGESINYNAYGDSLADLMIPPARLYEILHPYADPFDFAANEPIVQALREARQRDMDLALQMRPATILACGTVYVFPDQAWTRRVRGVFSNLLATGSPHQAHAVLTVNAQGDYTVSVRAPLTAPYGADALCRLFASGGGRAAAAGIGWLPQDRLHDFVVAFEKAFVSTRPVQSACRTTQGPAGQ